MRDCNNTDWQIGLDSGKVEGYNEALDDIEKKLLAWFDKEYWYDNPNEDIKEIIKELREKKK